MTSDDALHFPPMHACTHRLSSYSNCQSSALRAARVRRRFVHRACGVLLPAQYIDIPARLGSSYVCDTKPVDGGRVLD